MISAAIYSKLNSRLSGAFLKVSSSRPVNLNKVINGATLTLKIEDTFLLHTKEKRRRSMAIGVAL
jgi:hypothetical protein